jgi:hypothetical protein
VAAFKQGLNRSGERNGAGAEPECDSSVARHIKHTDISDVTRFNTDAGQ